MKNIKQNNLSLKVLQAEIDKLKNRITPTESTQAVKQSPKFTISSLQKKLWIFSVLLTLATRVPIISKATKLLSVWYGRTSWWKLLVNLRKAFLFINAMIGIYTLFIITGFSTDNIIAGITAIGHRYVEMLWDTVKLVFKWIHDLLDSGTPDIPKPPIDHTPSPGRRIEDIYDIYNPKPIITEWSLSTWLWYGGIALISIGAIYLGYKVINDPSIITGLFNSNDSPPGDTPTPPDIVINDTTGGISGTFTYLGSKISQMNRAVATVLNPFNYFGPHTNNSLGNFMDRQFNPVSADARFYPFTENNPYDSWFKKLKISILGESEVDRLIRVRDIMRATSIYDQIAINQEQVVADLATTPRSVTFLGFGSNTPITTNSILEQLQSANTEFKLKSIPSTPVLQPSATEWIDQVSPKYSEGIATTSQVTLDTVGIVAPIVAASVSDLDSPTLLSGLFDETVNEDIPENDDSSSSEDSNSSDKSDDSSKTEHA